MFTKTLLEIVIEWNQEPLHLFATHLEPVPTLSGEERRLAEVETILGIMQEKGPYKLLVGDLNALSPMDQSIPPSHITDVAGQQAAVLYQVPRLAIQKLMSTGLTDCYRFLHPDLPGYTYPSTEPMARIDYLFASPQLVSTLGNCEVLSGTTEIAQASDHCPLQAEFIA